MMTPTYQKFRLSVKTGIQKGWNGYVWMLKIIVPISFSVSQMTLMAVFVLIAHNLIQEGMVQSKSGLNPFIATLTRLLSASIIPWWMTPFSLWLLV